MFKKTQNKSASRGTKRPSGDAIRERPRSGRQTDPSLRVPAAVPDENAVPLMKNARKKAENCGIFFEKTSCIFGFRML